MAQLSDCASGCEAGAELGPGSREGSVSGSRGSLPQAPAGSSAQPEPRRMGRADPSATLSRLAPPPSEPPGAHSSSRNLPEPLSRHDPPWPCRPPSGLSCCGR